MNPPRHMPKELADGYTMSGQVPVFDGYRDDSKATAPIHCTCEEIDRVIQQVKGRERGHYACNLHLYTALDKYPIKGMRVLIFGSRVPWHEATCLVWGGKPLTIDYNPVQYDHPEMETMGMDEFNTLVNRTLPMYDAAFSISSFEHDGLGRYGDPLNPTGDLDAMQLASRILRPGGYLYLAVPVGTDAIIWNSNRIYGPLRLKHLFKGWKKLDVFGMPQELPQSPKSRQPIFVLQKEL